MYKMLKLAMQIKFLRALCHPEGSYLQPPNVYRSKPEASCDHPAGKGSSASCKHVTRISNIHRQVWQRNKPRPKKLDPILVSEFSKRKFDIVKKGNKNKNQCFLL